MKKRFWCFLLIPLLLCNGVYAFASDNYPSQSYADNSVIGFSVEGTADEGSLPSGTVMRVSTVSADLTEQIKKSTIEYFKGEWNIVEVNAIQIGFDNNGEIINPEKPVHIKMSSDFAVENKTHIVIIARDDKSVEIVTSSQMISTELSMDARYYFDNYKKEFYFDAIESAIYAIVEIEPVTESTITENTTNQHAVEEEENSSKQHAVEEEENSSKQHVVEEEENSSKQHAVEEEENSSKQHVVEEEENSSKQHAVEEEENSSKQYEVEEEENSSNQHVVEEEENSSKQYEVEEEENSSNQHVVEEEEISSKQHEVEEEEILSKQHEIEGDENLSEQHEVEEEGFSSKQYEIEGDEKTSKQHAVKEEGISSKQYEIDEVETDDQYEKTEIHGKLIWNDEYDQDGKRPDYVTIYLIANGDSIDYAEVDEGDFNFNNLRMYDEGGKKIKYSVEVDTVEGYTKSIDDFVIKFTHDSEKIEIQGTISWNDKENQDGLRKPFTIILKEGNKDITELTVSENEKKYCFNNLRKYEDGKKKNYSIEVKNFDGYKSIINGFNIKNVHIPETINIDAHVLLEDDNNSDARPEKITIFLKANGKKIDEGIATEHKNWMHSFKYLPKNEYGKKINYEIEVNENFDGYEVRVDDDFNIILKQKPKESNQETKNNFDHNINNNKSANAGDKKHILPFIIIMIICMFSIIGLIYYNRKMKK